MGLDKNEEEELFKTLFPNDNAYIEESLALPVHSAEVKFKALPFKAKINFLINFVKNYTRQEYTRWRIRRTMRSNKSV